ncbi:tetratricopeptide repeat protein [Candidatus Leptofilum sp.]|uniref:tetratricopeptide repeat protein n=1 Tax=Candidatus Leptofilum sp. TaxID=3241576 RepID=UPI003B598D47
MGQQIIAKLIPLLDKINWPATEAATEQGRQSFLVGLEKVDAYGGNPNQLTAALKTFVTGGSRPYAYAGTAYTVIAASQEKDGNYTPDGLAAAKAWLDKAQDLEPDVVEINMLEPLLYVHNGRLEDARLVLDYLHDLSHADYYLYRIEVDYWQAMDDLEKTVEWFGKTADVASTVPQRLAMRRQLADFYYDQKMWEEAKVAYREALHFDNSNPLIWHKLSIVHWQLEDVDEADKCNQQTLRLKDFPAARQMEARIKEKKSDGGLLGRLFG